MNIKVQKANISVDLEAEFMYGQKVFIIEDLHKGSQIVTKEIHGVIVTGYSPESLRIAYLVADQGEIPFMALKPFKTKEEAIEYLYGVKIIKEESND